MGLFVNRVDAGQKLAAALQNVNKNAIVLAIPRGGVIVGYQIAQTHHLPLDIVITKKVGAPNNPELAIGAVAEDGTFLPDYDIIKMLGVSQGYINEECARQKIEIERRIKQYRGYASSPQLAGRDVIVVDDGVATGATLKVALHFLQNKIANVTVALPVGPPDVIRALEKEAPTVICLATPEPFYAIGQFYDDFAQTTDQEVMHLLKKNRQEVTAWKR
jgi:predicted phosphoribosyltransferase